MLPSFLALLPLAGALACLGLGAFVLWRNPRRGLHQHFALGMAALAVVELGAYQGLRTGSGGSDLAWSGLSVAGEILLPGPWLAFSLGFGRATPGWRRPPWTALLPAAYALSGAFLVAHALGLLVSGDLALTRLGRAFSIFLLLALTATIANFELTLRAADASVRWRIKYMILGLGAVFLPLVYVLTQVILFSSVAQDFSLLLSTATLVGSALMAVSLGRHGVLESGVSLSRPVIYGSATVAVVGAYLLVVGLAVKAIQAFGGSSQHPERLLLFLGVVVLAVALLSQSLRRRARAFLDRQFFADRYDYRQEWLRLTDRLSAKLTAEELDQALAGVLQETFWIERTVLWLAEGPDGTLGSMPRRGEAPAPPIAWDLELVRLLQEGDEPVDLEDLAGKSTRAAAHGECLSGLQRMGVATLVPLALRGELVGILGLARPHDGARLSDADRELLRTMAKQAAAGFLIARLLDRVVRATELETFHALGTFVLHDLKNFVAMLSLVVQNMRRNFDNPDFRADALATLSQTVGKMRGLMDRLAGLSRGPELAREEVDLNDLVRESLAELRRGQLAPITEELARVPRVWADPSGLRTVITNLVMNAAEAVNGRGEIRVATAVQKRWATVAVADTGCGMTPEFIETRLFKPFATTKSGGFGIGLYQCKRIVDAHGGRLEVASEVGRGSVFTVLIPVGKD